MSESRLRFCVVLCSFLCANGDFSQPCRVGKCAVCTKWTRNQSRLREFELRIDRGSCFGVFSACCASALCALTRNETELTRQRGSAHAAAGTKKAREMPPSTFCRSFSLQPSMFTGSMYRSRRSANHSPRWPSMVVREQRRRAHSPWSRSSARGRPWARTAAPPAEPPVSR